MLRLLLRGSVKTESLQGLVRDLSARQLAPLLAAIFTLFSVLGPVVDISGGQPGPLSYLIRNSVFSGLIAIGVAVGALRKKYWLFVAAGAAQFLWIRYGATPPHEALSADALRARLNIDGGLVLVQMVLSYSFFLMFINGTAARYLRVRAEIDLAHQIHQVLVPPIDSALDGYEFAGFSVPSGAVGGDLVDVVSLPGSGGWFAYVADVSGHGVSSGVVMGMFKSALRMRLRRGGPMAPLLDDLNEVLLPLKSSSMFVTLACLRAAGPGALDFAVAGHLPILRVRGPLVEELTTPQIPIGMFEDYRFTASTLDMVSGDLLVLLTDGLIEVFDAHDCELGLDAVKALLPGAASRPLREIADAIVARARAHGAQMDDQTLLLIRRSS